MHFPWKGAALDMTNTQDRSTHVDVGRMGREEKNQANNFVSALTNTVASSWRHVTFNTKLLIQQVRG